MHSKLLAKNCGKTILRGIILLNQNRLHPHPKIAIRESVDRFGACRKSPFLKYRRLILERNLHTHAFIIHSWRRGKTPLRSTATRLASSRRVARRNSHAVRAYMRVQTLARLSLAGKAAFRAVDGCHGPLRTQCACFSGGSSFTLCDRQRNFD